MPNYSRENAVFNRPEEVVMLKDLLELQQIFSWAHMETGEMQRAHMPCWTCPISSCAVLSGKFSLGATKIPTLTGRADIAWVWRRANRPVSPIWTPIISWTYLGVFLSPLHLTICEYRKGQKETPALHPSQQAVLVSWCLPGRDSSQPGAKRSPATSAGSWEHLTKENSSVIWWTSQLPWSGEPGLFLQEKETQGRKGREHSEMCLVLHYPELHCVTHIT